MKNLFNIDNSEKNRILEMHINATKKQYLNEQQTSVKEFKASTDSTRMYNFPKKGANSSNSKFGLRGNPEQENYYFESTIADIVNQSKGSQDEYLVNFTPLNNAGEYVDYLKIGNFEISGSGSKTFDINKNMKVIASHNGLLVIRRLMEQMKNSNYNGENAKASVTIAGTERSSEFKTYNPNKGLDINTTASSLMRLFATLIVPEKEREKINKTVQDNLKKKTTEELKNLILGNIDSYLVSSFLPDSTEWKSIKQQYQLKGSESTKYQELFNKANFNRENDSLNQKNWDDFWNSYKETYLYNYSVYVTNQYPNNAEALIRKMSNSISNQGSSYTLKEMYDNLFANVKVTQGNLSQNTKSSGKKIYGVGQ